VDYKIARKEPIIVNVGHIFYFKSFGKFIDRGGLMRTSGIPATVFANVAKSCYAGRDLAILDKVNLKCMLDVMIKDPNLMCHDFNLL
jgi:hypothetical protein